MDNVKIKSYDLMLEAYEGWERDPVNLDPCHHFIGLIPDLMDELDEKANWNDGYDKIIQDVESRLEKIVEAIIDPEPINAEETAMIGYALMVIQDHYLCLNNRDVDLLGLIARGLSLHPDNGLIKLMYSECLHLDLTPKDMARKRAEEIKLRLGETKRLLAMKDSSNPLERLVSSCLLTPVYYDWNITYSCKYYILATQLINGLIDKDDLISLVDIVMGEGKDHSRTFFRGMHDIPIIDTDLAPYMQEFLNCVAASDSMQDIKSVTQRMCRHIERIMFPSEQSLSLLTEDSTYNTIKRAVSYHCISLINLGCYYEEIIATLKSRVLDALPQKVHGTFWVELGILLIQNVDYVDKEVIRKIDFATYSQNELKNWKAYSKAVIKARRLQIKELKTSVSFYKARTKGSHNALGCWLVLGTPVFLIIFSIVSAFITIRVFSFEWFISCCAIYMGIIGGYGAIDQIPQYGWRKWAKAGMLAFTLISSVLFILSGVYLIAAMIIEQ